MYTINPNVKVFQTLPGQGWRVGIRWNRAGQGITFENVIAWVTAKIDDERVIVAPLVRDRKGGTLVLVDPETSVGERGVPIFAFALVAPDEATDVVRGALERAQYPKSAQSSLAQPKEREY